ncbi:tetratricopeptide repeat protein [Rhodovulum tesquicola]|uniref:tetratricopeptide repeat protein n=1 Tax=Rhodovulum tesquicola TaxID=540254 RepID=UPI0020975C4C|nr:tetratricopeptide repeat protein [Rhodovulum tesquicola]MCO8145575.1 tetratricopeptide repeat protein [Rhodovulum tesquicola]
MWRAVLDGLDIDEAPQDWAGTQNNLGIALETQGTRTAGPEGAALLGEAVDAYREALRVRTEADHPVDWAMTMQNLGAALISQGDRTAGPKGAVLLSAAVTAYREALRVRTEAVHPEDWAMTMQNLGNALQTQGNRTPGPEGAALHGEAVAAYRDAVRVRTEAEHPVDWAMTQENMALAEEAIAAHDSTVDPRPHLEAALDHVEAALRVYDPVHMAHDYEQANALRARILKRLSES